MPEGTRKASKASIRVIPQTAKIFAEFYSNKNLGAFVRDCNDNSARLIGDPCNPLSMKVESTESKDGTKKTITLQQEVRDEFRILRYTGELPPVIDTVPEPSESL